MPGAAFLPRPTRLRTWVGLFICAAGALILLHRVAHALLHDPVVWQALLGGSVAALATALGTLPVLLAQRPSERMRDAMFGFGAGVMLAACAFSLIIPGLQAARSAQLLGGSAWAAAALLLMDRMLPHEHFVKGREGATGAGPHL